MRLQIDFCISKCVYACLTSKGEICIIFMHSCKDKIKFKCNSYFRFLKKVIEDFGKNKCAD